MVFAEHVAAVIDLSPLVSAALLGFAAVTLWLIVRAMYSADNRP